ncbi:MAG: aminotransferase class IV, partial [Gammaproteobacteria bacterium]|nr:aminotransferase class IV [Gammaproteobacteria bacterium]
SSPLYIQITRGCEDTCNHDFSHNIKPTVVAYSLPPITLGSSLTCSPIKVITLPDNRWNNCDVKSIALLGNILLRQQGKLENAEEVLLIRESGYIVEGTTSNYFIVKNNIIITPPLNNELLPGITRKIILELCDKNNIALQEQNITLEDILNADEVWLSSSTKEVRPVGQVNHTIINQATPGTTWHKIATLYINHIKNILNS